jgi:Zn-dependent protease
VAATLRVAAQVCVWTAVFNLLPVPPLTGAHLLAAVGLKVPKQAVWVATGILLVLLSTGIVRLVLTPVYDLVAPLVLGAALTGG